MSNSPESLPYNSLVPRPHPSRERGSGDFVQKPRPSLTFRQEFQTTNEIVENSILSLLGARNFKFLLQLRIFITSHVGLPVLSGFKWLAEL